LLVVITSDHGEEFFEHDGLMHGRHLYRETIHVPLVISMPGRVPAGVRIATPVSNAAIPSTILELIDGAGTNNATADAPFPSPSLVRSWTRSDASSDLPLPRSFIKHRAWAPKRDPLHFGSIRSVVSPRWHYVENEGRGREIFDWNADPRESANMADHPEGGKLLEQLGRFARE
jgi:arylsulfatase A-like enzyme